MERLNSKWISQVFFSLVEHGGIRVLDAVVTLTLIRVFTTDELGMFSVYQSWVAMLLLLVPSLDFILVRQYQELKSENKLESYLDLFKTFNLIRLMLIVIMIGAFSTFSYPFSLLERIALLTLAFALPFSQSFFGYMREIMRMELMQRGVALISLVQRILLILVLFASLFLFKNNILILVLLCLVAYVVTYFIWSVFFQRKFKFKKFTLNKAKEIKAVFFSVVIWIHFNGIIYQSIQTLDVFFLNYFKIPLENIAVYSITLKTAGFFQIIPLAVGNSFSVYLARNKKHFSENAGLILTRAFFAFVLLGTVLFALGETAAPFLLKLVGRGKITDLNLAESVSYFRWQLLGILSLAISFPLGSYITVRADLKRTTLFLLLPWLGLSLVIYFVAAKHGALAAAQANVAVGVFNLILMLVTWKKLWKKG